MREKKVERETLLFRQLQPGLNKLECFFSEKAFSAQSHLCQNVKVCSNLYDPPFCQVPSFVYKCRRKRQERAHQGRTLQHILRSFIGEYKKSFVRLTPGRECIQVCRITFFVTYFNNLCYFTFFVKKNVRSRCKIGFLISKNLEEKSRLKDFKQIKRRQVRS